MAAASVPAFIGHLARHGDAPALVADGSVLSYADLDRRARTFAASVGPARSLIAVEAAPSIASIVGLTGALLGGHAVALLPCGDAEAAQSFADAFAPDLTWRQTGGRWRLQRAAVTPRGELHPDLALLLMTSGSTGRPRAVRLSGSALDSNAGAIARYLELGSAERAALVLPLHYSFGLSVLTSHLASGASVWLHPGSVMDDGFTEALDASGATSLAGVPWTYDLLERTGFRDATLPRLRTMMVAGGRLSPERVLQYDAHLRPRGGRLFLMYGQTEATARIAYLPPDRAASNPDCIGIAIPGGALSLETEDGCPAAAGTPGELVYRGPNVMMGYAEGRADLARGTEVTTLRTGDIAERTPDGLYRILGRRRRMSKIAGLRISHDALEAALAAEGITAAVVGDDTTITAACDGTVPQERVRGAMARASGLPQTRLRVLPTTDLPRLGSGKPDYPAIRAAVETAQSRETGRTGVAEAFASVFHPRPVGSGDSFASLGGDSLRHVELALILERAFGQLPTGWEKMPVRDLAALGPAAPAASRIATEHLVRAAAILLVVVQHATLWPVPVGSMAMVVLIGFGLARYRIAVLTAGPATEVLRPLAGVLVPYFAIVAAYAVAWGQIPWASVFLVGNLGIADPERHTMLPYLYWFVEAFVQMMLLIAAVFAVPAVRRAARTDAFRFGLGFLAAALVVRLVFPVLWPLDGRQVFTLAWVLPMAAFGWCAATADTGRRRWLVLGLAAAIMPALAWFGGNWTGAWVRYGVQFGVVALLLFVPVVRLPRALATAVLTVAAAAFTIYLVHRMAPELLLAGLERHLTPAGFAVVAIVSGVALGLAVHEARRAVGRTLGPVWRARRSGQATTAITNPSHPLAPTV